MEDVAGIAIGSMEGDDSFTVDGRVRLMSVWIVKQRLHSFPSQFLNSFAAPFSRKVDNTSPLLCTSLPEVSQSSRSLFTLSFKSQEGGRAFTLSCYHFSGEGWSIPAFSHNRQQYHT